MKLCSQKIFFLFSWMFLFMFAIGAFADLTNAASSNLYIINVPVASDSTVDRNKAFLETFKKVLLQVTKNPEVISLPQVKAKFNKPEVFVKSYSYFHQANTSQQDLFLRVEFDPKAIESLLASVDIKPIAVKDSADSENKPLPVNVNDSKVDIVQNSDVLVWLTILENNSANNSVLSDSSSSDLVDNLKSEANALGIDVLLPVMDLSEVSTITAEDICNFNTEAITKASKKYHTSAVMIGCIGKNLTGKKGRWLILANNKQYALVLYGNDDEDIVKQAVSNVSEVLHRSLQGQEAEPNSVNAVPSDVANGTSEKIILKIEGVSNFKQYSNIIRYLQSIAPLTNVELINLNSSSVELSAMVSGGKDVLEKALASPSQNKLVPVNENEGESENNDFYFHYRFLEQ